MARTVKVRINHSKREQALQVQKKQRTMFLRILITVCLIIIVAAALSIGPVWLIADATRISQISAELKEEIADDLTVNQSLVIEDAVAKSQDRLADIAKDELGMVEPPSDSIEVTIDDTPAVIDRHVADKTFWGQVARLTMGEASSLLVGDVGISALR
jgi:cell division protein FtsL